MSVRFRKLYRSVLSKLSPRYYLKWKKQRMQDFYSRSIASGSLCFDIGAHKGDFSEIFLVLGARVIALEPIEESFQFLAERFKANINFTALPLAASAKSGEGEIRVATRRELSSMNEAFSNYKDAHFGCEWFEKRNVKLTTLDQLIERYGRPDFCKIDVEGHELEVLMGLSHPIKMISFEFVYPFREKLIECILLMTKKFPKARFNYSVFEFFEFENPDWLNGEEFASRMMGLPPSHYTGDVFCFAEGKN